MSNLAQAVENRQVRLIPCPHCQKILYLPIMVGYNQVCCPKCASTYHFQEYRFLDKSIEQKGEYAYYYRLRVQSSRDPEPKALSFRTEKNNLSFFQQDKLLVLSRNNSVALLQNLTEGWSERFSESRSSWLLGMGLISLIAGVFGYLYLGWWGLTAIPLVGGMLAYFDTRYLKRIRKTMADQLQEAKITQDALSLVCRDEESLTKITEELEHSNFIAQRLQAYWDDKARFGLSDSEINILERAIAQIQQSKTVILRLAQQYEQKLERIWLEIEIQNLTALMPDLIVEYQLKSQEMEAQFQAELDAISEINVLMSGHGD